jgi:hypothetical protein
LPLISSVRIAARNGVALDGVGFSVDSKGALPRQPSNAAPTQAPPEARNERRECARTKGSTLFPLVNWRVQITSNRLNTDPSRVLFLWQKFLISVTLA